MTQANGAEGMMDNEVRKDLRGQEITMTCLSGGAT